MPITLNGSTGITDADGGTVLSSADIATQAQAEAGTDNTKVMTPLSVAQAVAALTPPVESIILLGTLVTTSGSTQTLSGLNLTGYKTLMVTLDAVSGSAATHAVSMAGAGATAQISPTSSASNAYARGVLFIDLTKGLFGGSVGINSSATSLGASSTLMACSGDVGITTASTSISFSTTTIFDNGTIRIYGMK